MIILEILVEILGEMFAQIIFEIIILGFIRLIEKGFAGLNNLIFGHRKSIDPIKVLDKKYLYKEIELTDNLNSKLRIGQKGTILELGDRKKVFAEFYDSNGKQIQWKDKLIFEVEMKQFKLKK